MDKQASIHDQNIVEELETVNLNENEPSVLIDSNINSVNSGIPSNNIQKKRIKEISSASEPPDLEQPDRAPEMHETTEARGDTSYVAYSNKIENIDGSNLEINDDLMEKLNISSNKLSSMVNPNTEYSKSHSLDGGLITDSETVRENESKQVPNKSVFITNTNKISEGQGRSYISYSIKYGNDVVQRRYSDFENFRSILVRLFPINIIPSIPEKQTLKSYGKSITNKNTSYLLPLEGTSSIDMALSNINGTVRASEETFIRHRIRILTRFLNKLLDDDEIMSTTIVTDFLDPNVSNWSDFVNSSATFSSLRKSELQCNPLDPTNTTRMHACLPIPSSSSLSPITKERKTEAADGEVEKRDSFEILDNDHKQYETLMKNGIYRHNKRITKAWVGVQEDMNDLSEIFAYLSNNQMGKEATLAEQTTYVSNAYDESATELEKLVGLLYYDIDESFSELVYDAESMKELLNYRRMKKLQLNLIESTLGSKIKHLEKIEHKENETQKNTETFTNEISDPLKPQRQLTYGGLLKNKFNKLTTMVKESLNYQELDPESLKEELGKDIKYLKESQVVASSDLEEISKIIVGRRVSKYVAEREEALTKSLENYSKYMMEYSKKNMEIWKLIRDSQNT
ncbi:hypothetical protein TPHA_0C03580 [Tetrapisispora phaffii CBS 4417]|uniref:Autophagy-related protein 20 n=1 Tax=Tetrapisispora phaffii (strain ATCC 24235 / CBS 4417 / NBRC 1672 / NRRL Y-8282 / UCD 70-5) TaxID=1071381 RepID=G8BQJ8_TETPH|nr:hypothetical protein TPHA_0C03580 [Tetrapisispora phaffii CBS 4417]CCE62510.1 hypothetical protein TPHA_0C03580 [Tetrapisispora phaffii CBS 4417]